MHVHVEIIQLYIVQAYLSIELCIYIRIRFTDARNAKCVNSKFHVSSMGIEKIRFLAVFGDDVHT